MKQIIVTFDYDPETESVSNVKCTVDGIEKKKKSTKKISEIKEEDKDAIISISSNKLSFNKKCVSEMNLQYEDRIVIKWEKKGTLMVPIIGKDLSFDEEGTGNKLTKTNTITYKGKANAILADYGSEFTISYLKDGIWELIPTNKTNASLEEVLETANQVSTDLIIDTDDETIIDELKFQL